MICGMTYFEILSYFIIYSFIGWVVEVVYHAASWGQIINRGFLNGPVCPVYGFGVVAVFAMVNLIDEAGIVLNDLCLFFAGCVIATVIELAAGWLLYTFFHARWWDYSEKPWNLNGFICPEFSLIWGLAILLVIKVFQKHVKMHTANINVSLYSWIILAVIYALLIADVIVTVAVVNGLNKRLTRLDEITSDMRILSDKLSEKVGEKTIGATVKVEESRVQAALARAELRDRGTELKERIPDIRTRLTALKREYIDTANSLTHNKWFGYGRLLAAFPHMKLKKNQNILQKLREWKFVESHGNRDNTESNENHDNTESHENHDNTERRENHDNDNNENKGND